MGLKRCGPAIADLLLLFGLWFGGVGFLLSDVGGFAGREEVCLCYVLVRWLLGLSS